MPDEPEMLPGLRATVAESRARAATRRLQRQQEREPAAEDPVARVLVDLPLAHLDRPFDYQVPEVMAADAQPGVRVRVSFAGQDVDGYVVERRPASDHPGRLSPLRRVVGPERVLSPEVAELCERVADRYAGTRADVLRLAVPPRHARVEKEPPLEPATPPPRDEEAATEAARAWEGHRHAEAFLAHLADGGSPRAVWSAAPATDWPRALAHAARAAYSSGRGVLLCVPDRRDLDRLDAALGEVLGEGHHVTLSADAGPAARYRDFLAVSRGARRVVAGTRAAAFAPVADLGLVVIWDDGDDLYAEPRAPYPHTRQVLLTRAESSGAAALVAGVSRSVEAHHLLAGGWAREIAAPREVLRERVVVSVAGADDEALRRDPHARAARIPAEAHRAIRDALESGPVLVQTPRSGYAPALACERCRTPARCRECHGPLRLSSATEPPRCGWCGRDEPAWACGECGHRGLRAPVLGDRRTAEELGRTFAPTKVISSSGDRVRATVPAESALVVATPGAEPVAGAGYACVVLLDTWLPLALSGLRAGEEALRRWLGAAALVRPGGHVVAVGDPAHPALQALVRWDPAGYAARETAERAEARLPPAARAAAVSGAPGAVEEALALLTPPEPTEVLGPVEGDDGEVRAVLRTPRSRGPALSAALAEMQRLRSARKLEAVRVRVDPPL